MDDRIIKMNIIKEIKYFIQRGKRGYAENDLWSFDDYLCDIIPLALRELKKRSSGCSSFLWDEEKTNNECWKWQEILEEIAQGFEAAKAITRLNYFRFIKREDGYYIYEIDEEKLKMLTQKYERGMKLFKDFFLNLWD